MSSWDGYPPPVYEDGDYGLDFFSLGVILAVFVALVVLGVWQS